MAARSISTPIVPNTIPITIPEDDDDDDDDGGGGIPGLFVITLPEDDDGGGRIVIGQPVNVIQEL